MKLQHKTFEKNGEGSVTLIPEEDEDMWTTYNIICSGDTVRASTIRKIQRETPTGSIDSEKIKLTLAVVVDKIDFDPVSHSLRVGGRNVEESKHVRLGAHHTVSLELNKKFTVTKSRWDSVHIEMLNGACDARAKADVAAIIMQEGLAHVCLITRTMTLTCARLESHIPRKGKAAVFGHDQAVQKFFQSVMDALLRHIRFDIVKCVLLASPGFTKDEFFDYMMARAVREDIRILIENKSKFVRCKSSSGQKHALKEVLSDPGVMSSLADTKSVEEVKLLEAFHSMLNTEPDRAFYGPNHIFAAAEYGGIQTLMITDELFRSQDIKQRQKYVEVVENVRNGNGEVHIFSTLHVTGEQLRNLGGVAAILRFPIPDLDVDELDETDSSSDSD